jgi:hypothetical protein
MTVTTTWQSALAELSPYLRNEILKTVDLTAPLYTFLVETLENRTPASSALLRSNLLERLISDPELWPLPDAIRVAAAASRLDDRMDDRLMRHLTGPPRVWPGGVPEAEIFRVLAVLDAISKCDRLLIPLMKFAKLPNKALRSKAVKLMARSSRNPGWAETLLSDPDPRVRANLIDGLAAQCGIQMDALMRRAAKDHHHRVALTALLALCQGGDAASGEEIRRFAEHDDPQFRRAAEWALKQLEPPA